MENWKEGGPLRFLLTIRWAMIPIEICHVCKFLTSFLWIQTPTTEKIFTIGRWRTFQKVSLKRKGWRTCKEGIVNWGQSILKSECKCSWLGNVVLSVYNYIMSYFPGVFITQYHKSRAGYYINHDLLMNGNSPSTQPPPTLGTNSSSTTSQKTLPKNYTPKTNSNTIKKG